MPVEPAEKVEPKTLSCTVHGCAIGSHSVQLKALSLDPLHIFGTVMIDGHPVTIEITE